VGSGRNLPVLTEIARILTFATLAPGLLAGLHCANFRYGIRQLLSAAGSNKDSRLVMLKSWRIFWPRLMRSSRQPADFDEITVQR